MLNTHDYVKNSKRTPKTKVRAICVTGIIMEFNPQLGQMVDEYHRIDAKVFLGDYK